MILPPHGQLTTTPETIVLTGLSPYTFKEDDARFVLKVEDVENASQNGPAWKYFNAPLICDALEHPNKILAGLKRPNFEDGFCYSLVPAYKWNSSNIKVPAPTLKVFAVYVCPSEGELFVLDWDWRIACLHERDAPHNWQKDFTKVIYG